MLTGVPDGWFIPILILIADVKVQVSVLQPFGPRLKCLFQRIPTNHYNIRNKIEYLLLLFIIGLLCT